MVVGGVLYSVIVAAPRTKTVMNAPITSTLQDTVVFLGATSVVCSAGMVLNVAVAIVAWHKGVTAGRAASRRRRFDDFLDETRTTTFEWQRSARRGTVVRHGRR